MRANDRGSTVPLILGFFLIALLVVAASVALGQAFVQQEDLQATCDGAAAAAAASSADLDRAAGIAAGGSLQFGRVDTAVRAYLDRDGARPDVAVRARLSADATRVELTCEQTTALPFGAFLGHRRLHHRVTSTARAAVLG